MKTIRDEKLAALRHEDAIVRNRMLYLFAEAIDEGLDVTRAVVAELEARGPDDAFDDLFRIESLALDAEAVDRLLAWADGLDLSENTGVAGFLAEWISKAPVGILEERPDALRKLEGQSATGRRPGPGAWSLTERTARRSELAGTSIEACVARVDELAQACQDCDPEEFPDEAVSELELIMERLAAELETAAGLCREWLHGCDVAADDWDVAHWKAGAAIGLAGHLKLSAEAPRLVEMFGTDAEWWNEDLQFSLIRMWDARVLGTVLAAYRDAEEWYVRLYLAGIFEHVPSGDVLDDIVELARGEEEDMLRVTFGIALANTGTDRGLEEAKKIYDECPSDPERELIAETIYAFRRARGEDRPELRKYRKLAEKTRERMRQLIAGGGLQPLFGGTDELGLAREDEDIWDFPEPGQTVRREEPRIGRNDPCPCGSGKKYKKCCLNAGS